MTPRVGLISAVVRSARSSIRRDVSGSTAAPVVCQGKRYSHRRVCSVRIGGTAFKAKLKGNRKECGCYEARDIGEYDTCPHGCVYCYSVMNRALALERFRQHDPESQFLFPPPADTVEPAPKPNRVELSLIDSLEEKEDSD